jgi:hypothetical protein
MQRRLGSTGIRRKSNSVYNAIAEATKTNGEILALWMKHMAEASRDLKRSKIEV